MSDPTSGKIGQKEGHPFPGNFIRILYFFGDLENSMVRVIPSPSFT